MELSTHLSSHVSWHAKYILCLKKGTIKVYLILPTIDGPNDPTAIIATWKTF